MKSLAFIAGVAMLSASSPTVAHAADRSPEAKIAQALEGRVAGEPVDCINLRLIRSSKIIDGTAILYEGRGDTLYVNYPEAGARSLNDRDVQVIKTHGSRLCSIDTVELYDNNLQMLSGIAFLGDFIPYRNVADAEG